MVPFFAADGVTIYCGDAAALQRQLSPDRHRTERIVLPVGRRPLPAAEFSGRCIMGESMRRQTVPQRRKGAFAHCKWCGGNGCMGCDEEREKYQQRMSQPIFTADRNDPEDMEALRRLFGAEALQKAFGPDGGGMAEIERNAAIESLKQCFRKRAAKADSAATPVDATDGGAA